MLILASKSCSGAWLPSARQNPEAGSDIRQKTNDGANFDLDHCAEPCLGITFVYGLDIERYYQHPLFRSDRQIQPCVLRSLSGIDFLGATANV